MSLVQKVIGAPLALIAAFLMAAKAPDMYRDYIRAKISNNVVKLTNSEGTSGGTGSYIIAPSGKQYILTNAHVCGIADDNDTLYVTHDGDTKMYPAQVVERSVDTDLCVVEAVLARPGIKLASSYSIPQDIYIIGHPHLLKTMLSIGQIFDKLITQIVDHQILSNADEAACHLPKNRIVEVEGFFGSAKLCLIEIEALQSNAHILPGNSGSPVVNTDGKLVGVAFAGDSSIYWGIIVPLEQVKKFLAKY